jgi:IrrE N-terminal-like domain
MTFNSPKHLNPFFENVNENPEYEANRILTDFGWDGTLPVDLLAICEANDFEVKFFPYPDMKEPATTKFFSRGYFHIVINTYGTDNLNGFSTDPMLYRRQRFSLAHEMGHSIFKSHVNTELQKNLQNDSNPHSQEYKKRMENQANQFAAHLLIPNKAFKKHFRYIDPSSIDKVIFKVADLFDVSIQVAVQQVSRLVDFPCIAILFNADGSTLRTPAFSSDFSETKLFYPKSQDVPFGTQAAQILKNIQSVQCMKKHYRDASIWFPDAPAWKAEKFSIKETSIALGSYGVASFLEIISLDD